MKYHSFILNI